MTRYRDLVAEQAFGDYTGLVMEARRVGELYDGPPFHEFLANRRRSVRAEEERQRQEADREA